MKQVQAAHRTLPSRRGGIEAALLAAAISGFSVFLNGYAVKYVHSPTAFTAAKNLVAVMVLGAAAGWLAARSGNLPRLPRQRSEWALLGGIALIGGSIPFVLFFEGLARASATDAALIQKTLIIWVALLAVPLLGERVTAVHLGAIALLVSGQILLIGPLGGVRAGSGELMVLAATLCWSAETILLKVALRRMPPGLVGTARLGLGVVLILAYLAVRGDLGELAGLGASGWEWAMLMGVVLAAYVGSWLAALARAPAIDVTAVLVGGAFVTAALDAGFHGLALGPRAASLALIFAGVAVVTMIPRRLGTVPAL